MSKSDSPRRWFGLLRADRRSAQDDWADQGTAFGLDLSLSEAPEADDASAPRPTPPAQTHGDDWMQRLWARRKPAF